VIVNIAAYDASGIRLHVAGADGAAIAAAQLAAVEIAIEITRYAS
jgi:hypothetical protein